MGVPPDTGKNHYWPTQLPGYLRVILDPRTHHLKLPNISYVLYQVSLEKSFWSSSEYDNDTTSQSVQSRTLCMCFFKSTACWGLLPVPKPWEKTSLTSNLVSPLNWLFTLVLTPDILWISHSQKRFLKDSTVSFLSLWKLSIHYYSCFFMSQSVTDK